MRRPRHPVVLIALFLALTTGAWFGQAYVLFSPLDGGSPSGGVGGAIPGGEEVVRQFYAGIETFFTTGDDTAVRGIVGENFVEHASRPGTEPTLEGLMRYLGALRQAFPGLRLEPRDVVAQYDRVVVQVDVTGAVAGAFLGMPLAGVRPWGGVDIFRVAGDRIVAHWGDAAGQILLEPIVSGALSVPDEVDLLPALTRKSYASGTSDRDVPSRGPVMLLVESGTVVVVVAAGEGVAATVVRAADRASGDPSPGDPTETYGAATLSPGDALTVPVTAMIETRNDAVTPADVLVLSLVPVVGAGTSDGKVSALPPGLSIRPLAAGVTIPATREGQIVSIGRAVLLPGTGISDHIVVGQEIVLVEAGVLALTVGGGTVWLRHPNQTATAADRATVVTAGTSLGVPPDVVAAYRNDGAEPLTLLVVTIVPVGGAV